MSTLHFSDSGSLEDLRSSHSRYPRTAPCLNPTCRNPVEYGESTRGARPRFCSIACRDVYGRTRRGLLRDIALVREQLEQHTPQAVVSRELKRQLSHLRWLLDRYGGAD